MPAITSVKLNLRNPIQRNAKNTNARISANEDTDDNVIEGLHAVGTCSGSYYAGNYPVYIVGNCLGRQMTFGRYAVRYLQGEIQ